MNEWRDDWAQAFGESVGIVAIGFGLLGIAHRETTKRKPFTAAILGTMCPLVCPMVSTSVGRD